MPVGRSTNMQISDTEVKKILQHTSLVREIEGVGQERRRAEDAELVTRVVEDVKAMSDREDRVADLKARIEAGNYNPTGAEIADAMIRRSIADKVQ
ncbi:flagellar biosynthesis anti-sigma factor FlgM [bacterium]|nr:MAG: flagellar biosynthesis anti-sigma factor FlgM [bacterium]